MCLGSVNRLRQEASMAVAQAVEEAQQYVQQQPVVGADETSWSQGNTDGANERGRKAWLWVAVTPLVTYFQVLPGQTHLVNKSDSISTSLEPIALIVAY